MTVFDPAFARELEALRRRLVLRARSGGGGDHLSKKRGGSAEFLEHRAYAPGDDLRRIDWLAFARTGEPVFKLFRAEEDVVVRLLVDQSLSLEAGEPTKLSVATKFASAVGYMAIAGSERAQVMAGGESLGYVSEPVRGRGALPKMLRDLAALEATGGTDLAKSIEQAVVRARRPGMLVVVSDFMDDGPFDAAITKAASAGHDISLVQVLAREEVEPRYDGDFALEDAETGDLVEVTMDAGAVDAYLERLNQLIMGLRALSKKVRATYIRIVNDEPLLPAVRRFVARAVD
jgi:uncharacterized protein (DUF58 family)